MRDLFLRYPPAPVARAVSPDCESLSADVRMLPHDGAHMLKALSKKAIADRHITVRICAGSAHSVTVCIGRDWYICVDFACGHK
jgi:hypothetical protein